MVLMSKKTGHTLAQRNIMHYCKLRHSLFHNGKYIAYLEKKTQMAKLKFKITHQI